MTGRALLLIVTLGACAGTRSAKAPPLPGAAEVARRELTPDEQARHALSRLTFGARPGDVERVRAMGVDRWIAMQLRPERIRDDSTDAFVGRLSLLSRSPAELLAELPPPGNDPATRRDTAARRLSAKRSGEALRELRVARVARAVLSERQLDEVMVDFWLNHFNVFAGKGPERYLLPSFERDAIRPHALGKFRDLLQAVASSPAMLFYLDNWRSVANRDSALGARDSAARWRALAARAESRVPMIESRSSGLNENYARELLELHTLGVDGGYTQHDVVDVARAFTGWTIDRPRREAVFVFRPALHDVREKVVLGHRLPAGRGIEDGEEVLDILARHPSTARFIATKLVRRFVSDSVPPALVERVAATFTRTDGDVRECLRTIFTSPEFFSRAAYQAKVKSPFELVTSALRATGVAPDTTDRAAAMVARLGEPLYGRRDPNGYPDRGDAWMNAGAVLERIEFAYRFSAFANCGTRHSALVGAGHLQPTSAECRVPPLSLASPEFQRR